MVGGYMKKALGILTLALLVILSACGGNATAPDVNQLEETKLTANLMPGISLNITYFHEKDSDVVVKQNVHNELEFEKMGLSREMVEATMKDIEEKYNSLDGIAYTNTITDDKYTEDIMITISELKAEQIKDVDGLYFPDFKTGDTISLEKAVEDMKSKGFEEVE